VRVFIDFDGAVFWNGSVVDAAALERNLRNVAALETQPEIHIEPHRVATYAQVEQLIGAAKKTGAKKVAIIGPGSASGVPEIIIGTVN
jgi:biopolymer transport protein ExbD